MSSKVNSSNISDSPNVPVYVPKPIISPFSGSGRSPTSTPRKSQTMVSEGSKRLFDMSLLKQATSVKKLEIEKSVLRRSMGPENIQQLVQEKVEEEENENDDNDEDDDDDDDEDDDDNDDPVEDSEVVSEKTPLKPASNGPRLSVISEALLRGSAPSLETTSPVALPSLVKPAWKTPQKGGVKDIQFYPGAYTPVGGSQTSIQGSRPCSPGGTPFTAYDALLNPGKVVKKLLPVFINAPLGVYVKQSPILFGGHVICQIKHKAYVQPLDDANVDGIAWIRVSCGWICSFDNDGTFAYTTAANESDADDYFRACVQNRRRLASAICAVLTKSHSLPTARRISKAVLRHAQSNVQHALLNTPDLSIDELLNALNASVALKRNEIFEFIKIGASLQSDPPRAVSEIAEEMEAIISLRPTKWIKEDLNVLTTSEVERRNNRFIMACARGNWKEFNKCIAAGQELAVMHSMWNYTALHAAAEFGITDIVAKLCDMGMPVNVRDSRLGQTPLHSAAANGKFNCAQLLLDRGADRKLGCNRGQSPFELAEEIGNTECAELLKHRPPEIVHFITTSCSETTISVEWQAPPFLEGVHSRVFQYVLEWTPVNEAHLDPDFVEAAGPLADLAKKRDKETRRIEIPATEVTTYTLEHAVPASSYSCIARSQSKAGLSDPSNQLIAFTLCAWPDAPPSVEILKVTENGLLLSWLPPMRDNGMKDNDMKVNVYEIEIIDYRELQKLELQQHQQQQQQQQQPLDETGSETGTGTVIPLTVLSSSSAAARKPSMVTSNTGGKAGGNSMWHRVITHHNVNNRVKLIMGLEPKRLYCCRVRACNEIGWSDWSEWNQPVAPHAGVHSTNEAEYLPPTSSAHKTAEELLSMGGSKPSFTEHSNTRSSIALTWFIPVLSLSRRVTSYEVQMCPLIGPQRKNVLNEMISDYDDRGTFKEKETGAEYVSVRNDLRDNHIVIHDLRGGGKYQFRVRPQIDGRWYSWDVSVTSEVVLIPPAIPDCPSDLQIAMLEETEMQDGNEEAVAALGQGLGEHDDDEDNTTSGAMAMAGKKNKGHLVVRPDVQHDSVVIKWMNGHANGSAIVEFQVFLAKIREYRSDEVEKAAGAATNGGGSLLGPSIKQSAASSSSSSASPSRRASRSSKFPGASRSVSRDPSRSPSRATSRRPSRTHSPRGGIGGVLDITRGIGGDGNNGGDNAAGGGSNTGRRGSAINRGDYAGRRGSAINGGGADDEEAALYDEMTLDWIEVTATGDILGPQAFRAKQLGLGISYVFCVRQRNEMGWSAFSKPSPIVTTTSTLPPTRPIVIVANAIDAVIQWEQDVTQTFLEYQVQTGVLPIFATHDISQSDAEAMHLLLSDVTWKNTPARRMVGDQVITSQPPQPQPRSGTSGKSGTALQPSGKSDREFKVREGLAENITQVYLQQLSPGSLYVVRVKVKSTAGWSVWSEASEPFRTPSAP